MMTWIRVYDKISSYLILLGFAGLLFTAPFFRGLFFWEERRWALFFILGLFIFSLIRKFVMREKGFGENLLDYLVLALAAIYLCSVGWAADRQLAWGEGLTYLAYFLVYWLALQAVRTRRSLIFLLHGIYFSGVGMAAVAIAGAAGFIHIERGFVSMRICSTLQYPNSLASFLAALYFLGGYFGLYWGFRGNWWQKLLSMIVYGSGNYLLLTVFFASGSRGAFVILPVMFLVFLVGLKENRRFFALGQFLISILAAFIANDRLLIYLTSGNVKALALWLGVGLCCALLGHLVWMAIYNTRKNKGLTMIMIKIIMAFVIGVLCIAGFFQIRSYAFEVKVLPDPIVQRLQAIDIGEDSVQARFDLWKDALRIVKDHPVLGLGGGAFKAVYPQYETESLRAQVHNHYIQVWAETGTVGLGVFLASWLCYFLIVLRIWLKFRHRSQGGLVWAMFSAALMLGTHAFLDYDLSFPALAMILFALMGLTRGMVSYANQGDGSKPLKNHN